MTRILSRRPSTLAALALVATTTCVAVPVMAASTAAAAVNCEVWRSSGAGLTGFARCTYADGYPKFQVKVRCSNGSLVYGPVVGLGQTTWATCSSSQGGVSSIAVVGKY
jgi:hypothetical protein